MNFIASTMPRLAVNDDTAIIVRWLVEPGKAVTKGQFIAEVETAKSVSEIEADGDGYFRPIAETGRSVLVGQLIYLLTPTPNEPIETHRLPTSAVPVENPVEDKAGGRWTKKAELLAHEHGIEISEVPAIGTVREADVLKFIKSGLLLKPDTDMVDDVFPVGRPRRVALIGGGRGAVQVLDVIARTRGQRSVCILDDDTTNHGNTIMGVRIVGPISQAAERLKAGDFDAVVIAFSNDLAARRRVFESLRAQGIPFANVLDPTVSLHSNVSLGEGNVILAGCRLGSCAIIGDNNFLSAFVNLEHHNVLGSHCTFGPGVMTSSRVQISDGCRFGTGIFIEPGVSIGHDSIVASGSILTQDVPACSIVKTRVELSIRPIKSAKIAPSAKS
ncbi:MAG: hypothetical protein HY674_00600 [Chloroflexi bacterium]|nr:hypothetical protein [Chloroflexota bacterium]